MRSLYFVFGLVVIASLLIACGTSGAPATATVEPTATPEPPTATPLPTLSKEVPRISAEELKERLNNGEEIVIADTRGKSSYDRKHIAGAIADSAVSADSPLYDLPLDQEIVFYCT